ncbi:unnamed protein product [Closterium sp. NIES-64]|nr:unnamed protein product [Closterium sp. NIES-64]
MSLEPLTLASLLSLPVEAVSAKLRSTPPAHLEQLRVSLWDILGNARPQAGVLSLQRLLITRTGAGAGLSTESLSRAHYTHLKILVAVRTGIQAFLHPDIAIPPTSLIEIFLRRRCQNMACQSPLPAGGCRCRFCTTGNGEPGGSGRAGTDGGATKYRRDFRRRQAGGGAAEGSADGATAATSAQFACPACARSSELFGFVRDVFRLCSAQWDAEGRAEGAGVRGGDLRREHGRARARACAEGGAGAEGAAGGAQGVRGHLSRHAAFLRQQ